MKLLSLIPRLFAVSLIIISGFAALHSTAQTTTATGCDGSVSNQIVLTVEGSATKKLGEPLTVDLCVKNFNTATNFDLYVAVMLRDGTLLFMQAPGFFQSPSFTSDVAPYVFNTSLSDRSGAVLFLPQTPTTLPVGTYTFFAVLVLAGTDVRNSSNWVGNLASVAVTFGPPSLFTLVKSVQVTPSGNYLNGGFVRIAYVPGRDRFVVTFNTKLSQPQAGCTDVGYAYKEYTADMVETGNAGVISCHALIDTGGLFVGNDFYLASAERKDNVEGWNVAKFNAVTWANSVDYFYPLTDSLAGGGDPMVAYVNGQVDISSSYNVTATHHNFFTTDLQFVSKRVLSDTPHFGFNSMIVVAGVTNFLSSQGALGDLIVMWYDPSWTYLGVKTLKEDGVTPMGVAFDGNRFYVAYTDASQRTTGCLCSNVHLAAFDTSWNLVDYIAVTSLTLQDQMSAIHPSLAMKDNRLYVAYVQGGGIGTEQVHVKVYDVSGK